MSTSKKREITAKFIVGVSLVRYRNKLVARLWAEATWVLFPAGHNSFFFPKNLQTGCGVHKMCYSELFPQK